MLQARERENVDERMFVFSDVHLDQQQILEDINKVFGGEPYKSWVKLA